jgi:uncharacterized protein YyaL (SSP411 family)
MANRLQHETSPYLLQHANNPVDWYPWSEEAFERAKEENKPVLISIGYAACHWCHVMEHESFEDLSVADFMNEHFINIKVDREEHPDVDHLYMDALQAMTGAGGWPLNMFVTPDKKPFYGGTYFPPVSMYGRSSWIDLLVALNNAWHDKPEEIQLQSEQMLQHLKQASIVSTVAANEQQLKNEEIDNLALNLLRNADKDSGGFGGAPKFPPTGSLQFLLEYEHFHKNRNKTIAKEALDHALFSLDKMIEGGIYDQIGGGFSRYATDKDWLVPHFEKMLYDNALLISVLCDAYRVTSKSRYRDIIQETITFCKRELRSGKSPGFYCALDADSEGVEGKFYTWTWAQWNDAMGAAHPAVAAYFDVSEEGNWEKTNILNVAINEEEILKKYELQSKEWNHLLEETKHKLFTKRAERIRPATDDKMLLSWNALMNIALVDAAIALDSSDYLSEAIVHMDWMLSAFRNADNSLYHVWKNEQAKIPAKLDDYAYLIKALYHLASAKFDEKYIIEANRLMLYVNEHFLSEDKTFYYFSADTQTDILVRKVEVYDGATPAANSVMMENLWNMGNLMEQGSWIAQSEAMLFAQKQVVMRYPSSFARWAIFLQRYKAGLKQLVICGGQATEKLLEWNKNRSPEVLAIAPDKASGQIPAVMHKYIPGKTLLYLCEQFICKSPVSTVTEVKDLLHI